MIKTLRKRQKVFAWNYEDMHGVDREIAKYRIPIYSYITPIKQKQRRLRPEWALLINEEVKKQLM